MGVATAIAIGAGVAAVAGTVVKAVGDSNAANAKGNAANAQQEQARQQQAMAMAAAVPSASDLANQQKMLQDKDQALQRQEKLISALDPTIVEASNQANRLLKGESSPTLAPIQAQRKFQRTQLENSLREQLGSGFATSSAGTEALNRFDQDTASVMSGAQQQTLGMLLGSTANSRANAENAYAANEGIGLGIGQLQNSQRQLQVGAVEGTNTTPYAGAQYMGDIARGNALGDVGSGIASIGGSALSLAGGLSGGKKELPKNPNSASFVGPPNPNGLPG